MSTETTTHLSQLPNNNDKDNDLVNKILSELENISEEEANNDKPVLPSEENQAPVQAQIPAATQQVPTKETVNVQQIKNNYDSSMPSPQKINTFFNSIDFNVIKKVFRMSTIVALLFFVFTLYNNTFVTLFSKLPILKIGLETELSNSGKLLQGICFGLVYFLINIFYFDN
tara:strand:+ start:409 stop:921 length:513 start_codon:yes stop_codon:yes gene_type:complete